MKILLDMNLPPAWVDFLENHGIQAIHWSNVGSYDASDKEIMMLITARRI
jgi:predicted nuclease of predicted toxin-antitoxin system